MQKVFGWLFVVLAVWFCLELGSQGTQGAFGGRFAHWFEPLQPPRPEGTPPPAPLTDQVRDRVEGVMARYERDRERQAGGLR